VAAWGYRFVSASRRAVQRGSDASRPFGIVMRNAVIVSQNGMGTGDQQLGLVLLRR
jgi:hypothetical protein